MSWVARHAGGRRKLRAVHDLLDAKLVEIVAAWESGALAAAGLTPAEVGRFIRASFNASTLRADALTRVERTP